MSSGTSSAQGQHTLPHGPAGQPPSVGSLPASNLASSAAETSQRADAAPTARYVVLTGNPNCGKTTLFNALTGLRAKVGNYAGVTVERKEGRLLGSPADLNVRVLDLPGTYSLSPQSLDEQISRDVLFNRLAELPAPSLVVVVVDASNLQRNLYYATQVIELGYSTIIALNMVDVAENNGHNIDAQKLSRELGVPVYPVVASEGTGIAELKRSVAELLRQSGRATSRRFCELPELLNKEVEAIAQLLDHRGRKSPVRTTSEALLIIGNEKSLDSNSSPYPAAISAAVEAARLRLDAAGVDWRGSVIEGRYSSVARIQESVTTETATPGETFSDRLDRVLTHKLWGTLISWRS